jgi:hypothetical protein
MRKLVENRRAIALIAVVLVIAALGFVYFRSRQGNWYTPQEWNVLQVQLGMPSPAIPLFYFDESEVERVDFIHSPDHAYVFRQEYGEWTLMNHPDFILNPARVTDMLRQAWQLTALGSAFVFDAVAFPSQFFPEGDTLQMRVHLACGALHTAILGYPTVDGTRYYLSVDGGLRVYYLHENIAHRMMYTIDDLLCRYVPRLFADADFVRINRRGASEIIITTVDEEAVMQAPIENAPMNMFFFDQDVILPFTLIEPARLAALHPQNLAEFGLDEPIVSFEYTRGDDHMHLHFGNAFMQDGYAYIYVMFDGRPHVFVAEFPPVNALLQFDIMQLVQRFLFLMPIVELERITLESDEHSFEIILNHCEDFILIFPEINGLPAPESETRRLFQQMMRLGADADIEPRYVSGRPQFVVTYHFPGGDAVEVAFYEHTALFYLVSINGDAARFVTSVRSVQTLFESAAVLFSSL